MEYPVLSGQFKMENIPEIEELIKLISKLPGLGPKSARRIILKLINNKEDLHKPMVNSMANVFKNIIRCNKCGSIKSINTACQNCEKKNNKSNKICIVETISDQWSIENSNVFDGYFHILGGNISSTSNNKKEFMIESLIERIKLLDIEEVIIATSVTIDGQTTAYYIQDSLKSSNVKISKLAQGIPIGGELENLDDGTLVSAFKNRKNINI